ncbi:MAG: glutamate racemase [Zetaproteobacteria bacterium]|nr:MAG: glutamate racemase [Zetaproteobacteria bacterium]
MKLGIFDSGLGGLLIAKSIREYLPDIDIIYFGDTLHLPYGNRSKETIYEYSKRGVEFLFAQDCNLIITACNTISASALRTLQQDYLPTSQYSDRRILGVVVPTLECARDDGYKRLGLIATNYTVHSNVYEDELQKLEQGIQIFQTQTPLLVPLIEHEGMPWVPSVLEHYLHPLLSNDIECLILGCTHYPFLKDEIRRIIGAGIALLTQDEIIPQKLNEYLGRHPELADKITRRGRAEFLVSDITDSYKKTAYKIYGEVIDIEHISFSVKQNRYIRGNKA